MRLALLFLVFTAVPVFAAPVPKALKKPPVSLDGDWRWETQERNGQISPASQSDFRLWRVAGEAMTLIQEQGTSKDEPCRFVSESKDDSLRSFEYKVNSNGYHRRGVCELDGDTLRVAFSNNPATPPAAVKSTNDVSVYTFRRVTDTK